MHSHYLRHVVQLTLQKLAISKEEVGHMSKWVEGANHMVEQQREVNQFTQKKLQLTQNQLDLCQQQLKSQVPFTAVVTDFELEYKSCCDTLGCRTSKLEGIW